ncbi:TPA: hypothetical protein DEP96_01635 [Candidatus Uhrbacteria bacterium]|nr:hypothetical protein [Candidatus Uhrbacteria bacterium]
MHLFILMCSLVSSLALAADVPLTWIKPVDPNLSPSQATVIVLISRTHVDESTLGNINTWQPDGFLLIDGEQATKSNILAGLSQTKQYGHVILDVDMLGVGQDFGDPYLVPSGATPDDVSTVLRPSDIMKAVQGNQAWVAVISNSMTDGVTTGSQQSLIGPDASQWLEASLPGSNVFVLTATRSDQLPNDLCATNYGSMLFNKLATRYASGHDLNFYELTQAAKEVTGITVVDAVNGSAVCNFTPEARYSGSVTPKTVMLLGSGVPPDPVVVELAPKFTPVIDPTVPLTNVLMSSSINKAKPKSRVPSVLGFAAGGGCLVGGVVESVLYMQGVKEAKQTFAEGNLTDNFSSEADMNTAYDATMAKLSAQGNTAIGLYACAGLGVGLGTTTLLLSDQTISFATSF